MRRTAAWIDTQYRRPIRLAGDPDDEDAGNDDFDEDAEDDEEDWEDEGEEEEEGWRVTPDTCTSASDTSTSAD